ncbi:hypothetical protein CcaCcLH18_09516 [Colletotrichum camelliae]|nr:hypothetical protein CcaCcLH18_09516 [Colletotrichum camelliae]
MDLLERSVEGKKCHLRQGGSTNGTESPIRVAVIDTGIDTMHNNTLTYKDFVNDDSSALRCSPVEGKLQHGTQSVQLILSMYDRAKVFVAKVFESDKADERTAPNIMAKAVEWAVSQEVDIISISAGFKNQSQPLQVAIQRAHAANIIIFAAASNWGNTLGRVAYPARMKDHVLCIFAATGNNKSYREVNPEPRSNADNFAILGHDIELVGHSVRISGTSAAIALAAGMAARILDFERHYKHPKKQSNKAWMLQSKSGMTALLKALSYESEKYDCINPSEMLRQADEDEIENLEACKEIVWEFICRALQNAE